MQHPKPPSPRKLNPTGQASSTISGRHKAVNKLNDFLSKAPKYMCTFNALSPKVVCDTDVWLEFAHYLLNEAQTEKKGDAFKGSTVV